MMFLSKLSVDCRSELPSWKAIGVPAATAAAAPFFEARDRKLPPLLLLLLLLTLPLRPPPGAGASAIRGIAVLLSRLVIFCCSGKKDIVAEGTTHPEADAREAEAEAEADAAAAAVLAFAVALAVAEKWGKGDDEKGPVGWDKDIAIGGKSIPTGPFLEDELGTKALCPGSTLLPQFAEEKGEEEEKEGVEEGVSSAAAGATVVATEPPLTTAASMRAVSCGHQPLEEFRLLRHR
mmetsp:Transcript_8534/g.18611  ORF Transcript_8534/g.18611 Transcript_8534/m.18611 type:complete len:235 (-) Transcript_8534:323-1027(-)